MEGGEAGWWISLFVDEVIVMKVMVAHASAVLGWWVNNNVIISNPSGFDAAADWDEAEEQITTDGWYELVLLELVHYVIRTIWDLLNVMFI